MRVCDWMPIWCIDRALTAVARLIFSSAWKSKWKFSKTQNKGEAALRDLSRLFLTWKFQFRFFVIKTAFTNERQIYGIENKIIKTKDNNNSHFHKNYSILCCQNEDDFLLYITHIGLKETKRRWRSFIMSPSIIYGYFFVVYVLYFFIHSRE